MSRVDPAAARSAFEGVKKRPGASQQEQRPWKNFFSVVNSWKKKLTRTMSQGWVQCNKAEFRCHWKNRGKASKRIKKMWDKATSTVKINNGLAFWKDRGLNKKGKPRKKRLIVWVKEQERYKDDRSIEQAMSHQGDENLMDLDSFNNMKKQDNLAFASQDMATLGAGVYLKTLLC